jgi:isopentenyldiphosphate isomerase
VPHDDPSELFDLCDESGRPLGRSKPRAAVHRDGDWHRSIHVWVVLGALGDPSVLLQRRSASKDTHPGKVDVSVAGHLRAGESVEDALREANEEIGLRLAPSDVIHLGRRQRVDRPREGLLDREVQDIFMTRSRYSLESLTPDLEEVSALVAVDLDELQALVLGSKEVVAARERGHGPLLQATLLRASELVPAPDGYFAKALTSVARRLAGEAEEPWLLTAL